ncbi:hypothetical protein [Pseudoalteromonas piscicida]|uniref:hypothetical protein n=1 Tax=Pseudoalteromonas piscicida TaxID=43662 RepID=UPI0032C0BC7B
MTIVVAGYNFEKNFWREFDSNDERDGVQQEGLFAIADSIITSHSSNGYVPLLSGFEKIIDIPIKLWQPSFIDRSFQGYNSIYVQLNCFVAFAGSTLVSQHVINLIANHLANLRIDFRRKNHQSAPEYLVKMPCDQNTLITNGSSSFYGEDMFIPNLHYQGILTGKYICEVVERSITTSLKSARKHRLNEVALREMYSEFILGVACPVSRQEHLVKFTMEKKLNDEGVYEVFAKGVRVREGEVAVIGMSNRFGGAAQEAARDAIKAGESLKKRMEAFVFQAIKTIKEEGSFQIAMPMVSKELKHNRVSKAVWREET